VNIKKIIFIIHVFSINILTAFYKKYIKINYLMVLMKKKIYVVTDGYSPRHQEIYGSKKKLLESFFEIGLMSYHDKMEHKIDSRGNICYNCKNKFDETGDIYDCCEYWSIYLYCPDCDLFYCNNCVKECTKCNKKLISRDETHLNFKDKMKNNFEKDGISSLENLCCDHMIREQIIEFSDDE